jgi:leucyl aminopeptidase
VHVADTPAPAVRLVERGTPPACDAVVVGVLSGPNGSLRLAPGAREVDAVLGRRLLDALQAAGATGRGDEVIKIPTLGRAPFGLVLAAGVGDTLHAESARRAVGAALRSAKAQASVHVSIDAPVDALVEGALLGSYAFTAYKSNGPARQLRRVSIAGDIDTDARAALRRARIVATAVNRARDLVNTAPNDLYPETFATQAVELADAAGLQSEVLDTKALARGGYGGILAVGGGSARAPRLVRIAYTPRRALASVALVGKGITYDSGGLNLKTANLSWMKSDMGGAAAVLSATLAAAALRLPIAVTATIPMAENMPSGSAYRPSDVLTMRSGRTVEVADTDAEGRLVLADAMSRALEDEPDHLIEISTLTGAQLVALGPRVIGAMGEVGLRDRVVRTASAAGESVWAMPLTDDLRTTLDSPVADVVNVAGERWGAMLVAGHFLAGFVPNGQSWVHLDIAGPAWNAAGARDYTPKGGTGAGVRAILATLVDLAGPDRRRG